MKRQEAEFISYISTVLKYKGLHLQSNLFKKNELELLSLDSPVNDYEAGRIIDLIPDDKIDPIEIIVSDIWEDNIVNKNLYKALKSLSPQQQDIIWMIIMNGETEEKYATIHHISHQAVNKSKQRALKKILAILDNNPLKIA